MKKKLKREVLSEAAIERIAGRFRVLSEPTRLKLLMALEDGEKSVSQLVDSTGATQTNVSRQLAVLTGAGILSRRRSGLNVLYTIADPGIFDLCGTVCKSLHKRFTEESELLQPAKR